MYGYKHYHFALDINRELLLGLYKGSYRRVHVRTFEGLVVDIDAEHLRPFTTEDGISGCFKLTISSSNRFVSLQRIS